MSGSALSRLRQATRERHAALDRLMDLRRLANVQRYGRVLQSFDAFVAPWEASVAAALPASLGEWLNRRSRRHLLQQDLRALGLPRLPPAPVPQLPVPAAAWGSLYAVEGYALGGQVIARALADEGLRPGRGTAYFHGWGPATATMWREFRQRLEAELQDTETVEAACAAACRTFDSLHHLVDRRLQERTDAG